MGDILRQYGPDSNQPQMASAGKGGVMSSKDVMNYSPPMGPKGIMDPKSPGLHGSNKGMARQPTSSSESGSPGIGGTNHGCCGSQGKY